MRMTLNRFNHLYGGKGGTNPGIPGMIGLKFPDTGKHDTNFPVTRNMFCRLISPITEYTEYMLPISRIADEFFTIPGIPGTPPPLRDFKDSK